VKINIAIADRLLAARQKSGGGWFCYDMAYSLPYMGCFLLLKGNDVHDCQIKGSSDISSDMTIMKSKQP
jgi:hypothetical protein